jgi:CRP/FNR family cyclic AMP-dependent transcriptional regulator
MIDPGTYMAAAVADSCLADLAPPVLDRLLDGAQLVRHEAGTVVRRSGDPRSTQAPGLVVDGLLRVFRHDADRREVTARYVESGGLIGLAAVLDFADHALPPGLSADAVHDSVVLEFSADGFREALQETALSLALCRYLFAELLAAQHALAGSVLLPVRSRVAAHLLDLAERRDHELVVRATAQRLAAAAGSVREVVSRVLREMEGAGLVQRLDDRVVLVDTAALHRLAAGEAPWRTASRA